ncbi:hypothetical protein AAV33_00890 [Corynebacterium otitidis]|nr:hypothetical protein AAV33_00890 [Corynebacterium otitidis]
MPVVPTTNQFTANGGVLGLSRSAMPRFVARSEKIASNDGDFGAQYPARVIPPEDAGKVDDKQKTLIDQRVHWKNDFGLPVQVQVQIQRARRTMALSAPNFAFLRERYTVAVGTDGSSQVTAPEPETYSRWDTEWGGGIDTAANGEPVAAIFRQSTPESTLTLEPRRVAEGQSIDVRFRVTLITPYTWWQPNALPQAAKDSFTAHMRAFANTITLLAIPEIV